ncbi:UNVERIFIED_CONTAM: Protein SIEVE ELEMENT OCCLUSION A, partial [Sesamum indicum]
KNRIDEVSHKLKRLTESTSHKDNVIVLKALISEDEDKPLYDGCTQSLVKEGKHICLYGGTDIEWIRQFTSTLLGVSQHAQIQLKMIHMDQRVKMNNTIATSDDVTLDLKQTMAFWARLHSIWQSRVQSGMFPESDEIIRNVFKMFSLNQSGRGWAIVSSGAKEMAIGMGDTVLKALLEYDKWKESVVSRGFVPALREYMTHVGTSIYCNTFAVSKTSRGLPEKMICFECRGQMKMSTRFVCFGD